MKGIIYTRVSSDEQVKGTSLEFQRQVCRKYCEDNNIEIVAPVFEEQGQSAKSLNLNNRTKFLEALQFCRSRKNQIDAFVVLRVDRFARNTEDHFSVRQLLLGCGTTLHSVTEPIGNQPAEKFIETVLAGAAEYDNAIRKQRCSDGMSQRINNGIWPWKAPVGYKCQYVSKRGEKKTEPDPPDPQQFPIIQRALKHYATGTCTQTELAPMMDHWGLASFRGKKTTKQFVELILKPNRLKFYAGILHNGFTGEDKEGLHEPMITKDEMYRIILVRAGRSVGTPKRQQRNPTFPLRRTVLCGSCIRPLTGARSHGNGGMYYYYFCFNHECTSRGKVIPKKTLENEFQHHLKKIAPKEKFIVMFNRTIMEGWKKRVQYARSAKTQYNTELSVLENKRKKIFELKEDGTYTKGQFRERLDAVEIQLAAKKIERNETSIDQLNIEAALLYASQFMRNIDRQWFDLKPDNRLRFEKLVFPEGIPYVRGKGFRTTKLGCIFELNQQFDNSKSLLVDLTRLHWNQIIEDLAVFAEMEHMRDQDTAIV